MQEKIEAFLNRQKTQKGFQEQLYRYQVLEYADLLSTETRLQPATKMEFRSVAPEYRAKKEDGYYIMKKVPLEVTDEEFSAVEAAVPKDVLEGIRLNVCDTAGIAGRHSHAATFFNILAIIIWVVGLITAILISRNTVTREFGYTVTMEQFNFLLFATTFAASLLTGGVCLCVAELFMRLKSIENLLKRKG